MEKQKKKKNKKKNHQKLSKISAMTSALVYRTSDCYSGTVLNSPTQAKAMALGNFILRSQPYVSRSLHGKGRITNPSSCATCSDIERLDVT